MAGSSLRILGIDPGTRRCGYGLIDWSPRHFGRPSYVECGVIELAARTPLHLRLAELAAALREVIDEHSPTVMAVEEIYHGIDARAALTLGHARGVALAAAGTAGMELHPYQASTVKRAVAGGGRAAKSQVARMVCTLLGMRREPPVDAADALAVAICHSQHVALLAFAVTPPLLKVAR